MCRGHREQGEGHSWPEGASTAGPGVWEGGRWGRNEGEPQSGSWGMGGGPGSLWLPSSREPPEPPAVLPRPRPAPPARPGRSPGLLAGEHPGGPGCPPDTPASSSCPCRPCGGCHMFPPRGTNYAVQPTWNLPLPEAAWHQAREFPADNNTTARSTSPHPPKGPEPLPALLPWEGSPGYGLSPLSREPLPVPGAWRETAAPTSPAPPPAPARSPMTAAARSA